MSTGPSWLEQLFPHKDAGLPALSKNHDRSYMLNSLAISYQFLGHPGRAVQLYRQAIEILTQLADNGNRMSCLGNLGATPREIGSLREAEGALRHSLILSRELENEFWEGVSLQNLGRLLLTRGDIPLGIMALNRARYTFSKSSYLQSEGVVAGHLAERSMLLSDFARASALADKAWELASHHRHVRDSIDAALRQGEADLGLNELMRASERLYHALTRARSVNLVELELPALIAITRLELAQGHPREARGRLNDVWDATERGPYPLCQADAFNVLADIALAENDEPAAIDAATKAYRAAWCDGPPYSYHWGLVKAKAHLAALGALEPEMPLFDESRFEPMPEVEINPKDEYWVDPDKLE
jgi:tetratricopeptide (TPR) repeat protein